MSEFLLDLGVGFFVGIFLGLIFMFGQSVYEAISLWILEKKAESVDVAAVGVLEPAVNVDTSGSDDLEEREKAWKMINDAINYERQGSTRTKMKVGDNSYYGVCTGWGSYSAVDLIFTAKEISELRLGSTFTTVDFGGDTFFEVLRRSDSRTICRVTRTAYAQNEDGEYEAVYEEVEMLEVEH